MDETSGSETVEVSETRPHTILVPIGLSFDYYRKHMDDDGFSVVDMMVNQLKESLNENFGINEERFEELTNFVPDKTTQPGEITGNIETDKYVVAAAMLRHPQNYAFRWFADNDRLTPGASFRIVRDLPSIMDNLNTKGWEVDFGVENPTSTTGDPKAWQYLGEPDRDTKQVYLLAFPSDGIQRKTKIHPTEDLPETYIQDGHPKMEERQKYLYAIKWK